MRNSRNSRDRKYQNLIDQLEEQTEDMDDVHSHELFLMLDEAFAEMGKDSWSYDFPKKVFKINGGLAFPIPHVGQFYVETVSIWNHNTKSYEVVVQKRYRFDKDKK